MVRYNPTLCNKCFIFPCVCGEQYKLLSTTQLNTLSINIDKLINLEYKSRSLKDILSQKDMGLLPKKFIKYLFHQKETNEVNVLWDNLKDSDLLWKSCLAMFLSRYALNTTTHYYNFIINIISSFDMRYNDVLSQILLAANANHNDINIPLILSSTNAFIKKVSDDDYIKSYVIPCVRIACYKHEQPIIELIKNVGRIIIAVSGLSNDIDLLNVIDNTPINIEDQMIFVDKKICELMCDNFSNDFQELTLV